MMVRFTCPACKQSHTLDMPETTIHMTCSRTHKTLRLRVTKGGDCKAEIVDGVAATAATGGESEE